jgi:hypothetical protein
VERTNEKFAEEYLGGTAEDYDVINKRSGNPTHATSGNMEAWNAMMAIANAGLESAESYAAIQQYLDIDDFIDYMLINQYATNHDGPDQGGNNMRALRRRDETGRFTFHVWDMEYTFWYQGEHRNIDGDVADAAMRLFSRLRQNSEFQLRFADRVQKHLFDGGALTPEKAAERYRIRADEIDTAIIGESARWGDGRRAQPYTRDVEWVAERDRLLNEYFPARTQILLDQFQRGNLYPYVSAPLLSRPEGQIAQGAALEMDAPAGTIYYTLDGSDPRLPGGAVSPSAQSLTPRISLVPDQSSAQWLVPRDGRFDGQWTQPGFVADPNLWLTANQPLGFDRSHVTEPIVVPLQSPTATFSEARRPIEQTIDGDPAGRGWGFSQPVDFQGPVIRAPIGVWETVDNVGFQQGTELTFTLMHDSRNRTSIGRFRILATTDSRDEFADGLESGGDVSANWHPLQWIELSSTEGAEFTVMPDNSLLVAGGENSRDSYQLRAITPLQNITGFRIEIVKDPSLPGQGGPGRGPGGVAYLTEFSVTARPANLSHQFDTATASALAAAVDQAAEAGAGTSIYLRMPFRLESPPELDGLKLSLAYPDGFVAFLNGVEILRRGADPGSTYATAALEPRADSAMLQTDEFDVSRALSLLRVGDNVLAVQMLSHRADALAATMNASLIGTNAWRQVVSETTTVHARTLDGDRWSALVARTYEPAGDLSGDGIVNAVDINQLCAAIHANDLIGDLNRDGTTDLQDHGYLVDRLLGTSLGDVNLDGRFDSRDLVLVFQRGLYEQNLAEDAVWESGDWNCDGRFDSADLVAAFATGRYQSSSLHDPR